MGDQGGLVAGASGTLIAQGAVAACLVAALVAHVADLAIRWRR